jgi:hypothetical protein
MAKAKARFTVEDLIVSVTCPGCGARLRSPGYPDSFGWDKSDVRRFRGDKAAACESCRESFRLPVKLFDLFAGL